MYINNWEKQGYDSFIFGSSTALFVTPLIWKNYLDTSSHVFSFDASRENIIGIWSKIKYIDHNNQAIKNALFVIDYDKAFSKLETDNVLFTKHHRIYPSSWFDFQAKNFLNFLNPFFLRALISFQITNEFKPFMAEFLIDETSYIDPVTNEFHSISVTEELKHDSIRYYEARKLKFPARKGSFSEYRSQINDNHMIMLKEIKEIFDRNKTIYKIIIAPNYEEISFSRADLDVLNSVFGKENVYDFTGVNRFSEDMSNFYDGLHFKTYVGKQLLDITYAVIKQN
jgi:hypothetical protein